MNVTLFAIGVVVIGLFASSIVSCVRERTSWRFVHLSGALCLVVVVLTHLAETLGWLPDMGWGVSNSPGHYLDLVCAALGLILFPLGYFAQALARKR
jgi:hypothetical protein